MSKGFLNNRPLDLNKGSVAQSRIYGILYDNKF